MLLYKLYINMEFSLNKLDNAIYFYMHDKTDIFIDINTVYAECSKLCPELFSHNILVFNKGLDKALENYKNLQLFESNVCLQNNVYTIKKYLVLWKDSIDNLYPTITDNNSIIQFKLDLEEKNKNLNIQNKSLTNKINSLLDENNKLKLELQSSKTKTYKLPNIFNTYFYYFVMIMFIFYIFI